MIRKPWQRRAENLLSLFARKYTFREACMTYLATLLVLFLSVGIGLGGFAAMTAETEADLLRAAETIGVPVVAVLCTSLSILCTHAKRRWKDSYFLAMIFLTVMCSFYGGALFGLVIPAHLSTKERLGA